MSDCSSCSFTSKFCTQSGGIVIAKLDLKNGVLTTNYYNLDGSLHEENDIVFSNCG